VDAAALAAASDSTSRYLKRAEIYNLSAIPGVNAQAFASMNNNFLANYGIHAIVTGISVNAGADTVRVQVSADPDRFFPSVVLNVVVIESGEANIRAFTH
jgi:hypothetical protein